MTYKIRYCRKDMALYMTCTSPIESSIPKTSSMSIGNERKWKIHIKPKEQEKSMKEKNRKFSN